MLERGEGSGNWSPMSAECGVCVALNAIVPRKVRSGVIRVRSGQRADPDNEQRGVDVVARWQPLSIPSSARPGQASGRLPRHRPSSPCGPRLAQPFQFVAFQGLCLTFLHHYSLQPHQAHRFDESKRKNGKALHCVRLKYGRA